MQMCCVENSYVVIQFGVEYLDYVKIKIDCYLGTFYTKGLLGINIVDDVSEVLTLCVVAGVSLMKFNFGFGLSKNVLRLYAGRNLSEKKNVLTTVCLVHEDMWNVLSEFYQINGGFFIDL